MGPPRSAGPSNTGSLPYVLDPLERMPDKWRHVVDKFDAAPWQVGGLGSLGLLAVCREALRVQGGSDASAAIRRCVWEGGCRF